MERVHFDISKLDRFLEAIENDDSNVTVTSSLLLTKSYSCGSLDKSLNFYCGYPYPIDVKEIDRTKLEKYLVMNQGIPIELPDGKDWVPDFQKVLLPQSDEQFQKWCNMSKANNQISLYLKDPGFDNQVIFYFVHLDNGGTSIPVWYQADIATTIKFEYNSNRHWDLGSISLIDKESKKGIKIEF
jgi:hypothetical protein